MDDRLLHLREDQQRRYQRGDSILVEAYLAEHPDLEQDPETIAELLQNEYLLRIRNGETPKIQEYADRFPDYLDRLLDFMKGHQATPATPEDAPVGRESPGRIAGFRIDGEIGRGGMGTVYRAWDETLGRWVAVKTLRSDGSNQGRLRERLKHEAEAIARLHHPNIVEIHEVGDWQTASGELVPFLVLEYASRGSLSQHLGGKPQPSREAAALVETLARAVEAAHGKGIIHRDLKPGNVLLFEREWATPQEAGKEGVNNPFLAKITDFGLAKDTLNGNQLTASGEILGTPSYMAPEQVRPQTAKVGPPADIYALGAILYELLTGRPPFQAASQVETVLLVLHEAPVPPRRLQPRLDRDLDTIVLKCLEKEPSRRYASAAHLADDLRRYLEHRAIQAKPASSLRMIRMWIRRNPTLASLLLLGCAAAGALSWQWFRFTEDLRIQRDLADEHAREADKNARDARIQTGLALETLKKARETALSFFFTIRDHKDLQSQSSENLRMELLKQAINLQDQLIGQYGSLADLRSEQANCYHVLSQLVRNMYSSAETLPFLQKAFDLGEKNLADHPENIHFQAELATFSSGLGLCLGELGKNDQAADMALRSLSLWDKVIDAQPDNIQFLFNRANTKSNLGLLYRRANKLAEAEVQYLGALKDGEEVFRREPNPADHLNLLGLIHNNLAVIYKLTSRTELANDSFEQAMRRREDLVQRQGNVPQYLQGLAVTCHNAGGFFWSQKRYPQAEIALVRAREVQKQLVKTHPDPRVYRSDLSRICHQLGLFYLDRGEKAAAEKAFREAVDLRADLAKEDTIQAATTIQFAESLLAWSKVASPDRDTHQVIGQAINGLKRWPEDANAKRLIRSLQALGKEWNAPLGGSKVDSSKP